LRSLLDEIAIYNRALSPTEIQATCQSDNHGHDSSRLGKQLINQSFSIDNLLSVQQTVFFNESHRKNS
jgi:hypothetical protein